MFGNGIHHLQNSNYLRRGGAGKGMGEWAVAVFHNI